MCGILGMVGPVARGDDAANAMTRALARQHHRGPDGQGQWHEALGDDGAVRLGHNRLAIIDLSPGGRQPMTDVEGRYHLSLNGEIYNYRELRAELDGGYPFRTASDTEVLLAAWRRWGPACLERLIGMFAFLLWDRRTRTLHAVRDRFGVKPLYVHHHADGSASFASEIGTLHAMGIPREPAARAWARYLTHGTHDEGRATFWRGIERVPAGCRLRWRAGETAVYRWYDLESRVGDQVDDTPVERVRDTYAALLDDSVSLRFRADVPVGVNLSGGLDSSALLASVHAARGADSDVRAFTFVCGDERYDELPWVERMLAHTRHPLDVCQLRPDEVPDLAASVATHQDEPYGGLPTLAYAKLFEHARARGIRVLLDGQGMDEQWAGYDYHRDALAAADRRPEAIQGTRESPVRPSCLTPELRARAGSRATTPDGAATPDARLRDVLLRDLGQTKLPRALRFNDRVSMRASCELREPFLDHRLVELALRQPADRKIRDGEGKWLLRRLVTARLPTSTVEASKRALQTPQREWLRGPLAAWADATIEGAIRRWDGAWLDGNAVRDHWRRFRGGEGDNSFFVWQWIGLGLLADPAPEPVTAKVAATPPPTDLAQDPA